MLANRLTPTDVVVDIALDEDGIYSDNKERNGST